MDLPAAVLALAWRGASGRNTALLPAPAKFLTAATEFLEALRSATLPALFFAAETPELPVLLVIGLILAVRPVLLSTT